LLSAFLSSKERCATTPQVAQFAGLLREFVAGGKRLRPLLSCCGWRAVTGLTCAPTAVAHIAASLELSQAFVLIQDDVMDDSDTRRGRPSMHRMIAALYPCHPAADRLGRNAAILLGDLALGWSYEMVHAAGMSEAQSRTLWPLLDAMRTDTMAGQYLDLVATRSCHGGDLDAALAICRYKTAKYTIEYPLLLGAQLAGAAPHQLRALTDYALPLGEAFQLRDDVLGVFGDPDITGKSSLDDLREGKHTALIALAIYRPLPPKRAFSASAWAPPLSAKTTPQTFAASSPSSTF
jgi:geranylgeranyl diphosphate synthase, type I